MLPSARLQAVIDLLETLHTARSPADGVVKRYMAGRRYIGAKDRRAITERFYLIVRHRAALCWWAEGDAPRLLVLVSCVFFPLEEAPEQYFTGIAHAPAPLTPDEKSLLQRLHGQPLHPDHQPLHVRYNLPEWLFDALRADYREDWQPLLEALKEEAPTDIRVNRLKSSPAKVQHVLAQENILAEPIAFLTDGLRLHQRTSLSHLPLFKQGAFEVQDAGSQLAALCVDVQPGQCILDFCAGAGGKTLAIASRMQNKGRIIACDISPARLEECSKRCARAGVTIVENIALDVRPDIALSAFERKCDHVIVDAPCTGTGTLRRHPDARFRYDEKDLATFIITQREVLAQAQAYVAGGGTLTYITCSLLRAENSAQAQWFLSQFPDFFYAETSLKMLQNFSSALPKSVLGLQLLPSSHRTDGLYVATFRRHAH